MNFSIIQYNCQFTSSIWQLTGKGYIIQILMSVLVMICISIFNVIFIYGLWKTKKKKSISTRLFMMLSIANLCLGCVTLPLVLVMHYLQPSLCVVALCICSVPPNITAATTVVLACHRYFAIVRNNTFRLSWNCVAIVIVAMILLIAEDSRYFLARIKPSFYSDGYSFYSTASIGVVIILTPITMYVHLVFFVKQAQTQVRSGIASASVGTQHTRATYTVIILLTSECMSYGLYFILRFYITFFWDKDMDLDTLKIMIFTGYYVLWLHSFGNTCILIFRNNEICCYYKNLMMCSKTVRPICDKATYVTNTERLREVTECK